MAAEETILTWNFTNWLTVVLMAVAAYFVLGWAQKWYQARQGA